MVAQECLRPATHGTLNVHDSLLPEYAGFSPVLWALLNRESRVGVTVHRMDETLDGGPIVAQQAIPVGPSATTTELVAATTELIEPLVLSTLSALAEGTLTDHQQDPARATYFHKRSDRESRIDFTASAADIELLVRAQSDPYPNAHFRFRGERLRVIRAHVSRGRFGGTPGRVTVECEGGIAVVCGSDAPIVRPRRSSSIVYASTTAGRYRLPSTSARVPVMWTKSDRLRERTQEIW